jgi:hypothetical protein
VPVVVPQQTTPARAVGQRVYVQGSGPNATVQPM